MAAPAILRRVGNHPRPHRIQVDIGRNRPCRDSAIHDHALAALLPQSPAALVRVAEPPREALQQRLHKLREIVHPVA